MSGFKLFWVQLIIQVSGPNCPKKIFFIVFAKVLPFGSFAIKALPLFL